MTYTTDSRCGIVEISEKDSLEIDTPFDLDVAEALDRLSKK